MSKYLISDLISQFFLLYMKKSLKSSLKKRSLDISLQHKNEASYKFSKKNFCTWPKKGLELKGLNGGWYADAPVRNLKICEETFFTCYYLHFAVLLDRKCKGKKRGSLIHSKMNFKHLIFANTTYIPAIHGLSTIEENNHNLCLINTDIFLHWTP